MATFKRPAKMEYLDEMLGFIFNEGCSFGFDKAILNKVKLACEEAIVNVVNYAYDHPDGHIEIRVYPPSQMKGVVIDIMDWGKPFNPLDKPDPDLDVPVDDRPIGGLGIFMIRKIMDNVEYFRQDDHNLLRMTKYL